MNQHERFDDDPHLPCDQCGNEHPEGVLDGGLCPSCVDEEEPCDCADKVPANLAPGDFWTCPKCDAQWHGEEQDQ